MKRPNIDQLIEESFSETLPHQVALYAPELEKQLGLEVKEPNPPETTLAHNRAFDERFRMCLAAIRDGAAKGEPLQELKEKHGKIVVDTALGQYLRETGSRNSPAANHPWRKRA